MTCLIYTTFPTREAASTVAHLLIEQKLAVCCNILAGVTSHYQWEGKIETADEVVMICKTVKAHAAQAMETIRRNHPYECPAILELPVENGDADFLNYIRAHCIPE